MSEHQQQAYFFNWVRRNIKLSPNPELSEALELCYAVPNGAEMKPHERQKMVMEGMTKGVWDVALDYKRGIYSGLRLEFKWKNPPVSAKTQVKMNSGVYLADLSPEQRRKRELYIKQGYIALVVYSCAQAVHAVMKYLPFHVTDYIAPKYI